MRNYYEILLALIVSSNEEEIKTLLERLEKIMNSEGAIVEEIQRLDRKEFAYPHRHQNSAFYTNFMITAEPASIAKIRQKLALLEEVTLQNYFQKGEVSTATTKAPKPAMKLKKASVEA
ncbi:MAG: 30S ribosomal protein S6 [Verrucomicrobia bacterium]|jgi:ribosomal protein S6|nr:MAG: 30S ribosomal protein S6 [Verrucomicrobiota bacterium]MDH4469383.1 30S ribosomal protein S6 [Verrucomicrobiae bacterium]